MNTFDIFLSYSSKDHEQVLKLAHDLKSKGFSVWLDKWEIRVGDPITQMIERGLSNSRFLGIWLTDSAVKSGWVQKEWQAKFADEAKTNNVTVLPLLGENCDIHSLLRDKKYADFTKDYQLGLDELLLVLGKSDRFDTTNEEAGNKITISKKKGETHVENQKILNLAIICMVALGILIFLLTSSNNRQHLMAILGWSNSKVTGSQQGKVVDQTKNVQTLSSTVSSGWTLMTELATWSPRYALAGCYFKERFWILGGHKGTNSPGSYPGDIWNSQDGRQWTEVFGLAKWSARKNHSVVVHRNMLWVLGGVNVTAGQDYQGASDVWSSPDGKTLTEVIHTAPWGPRWSHASVAHSGHLWILGGVNLQDGSDPKVKLHKGASSIRDGKRLWLGGNNDVWRSKDGNNWTFVGRAPWTPRWGHAATIYSGMIWVFGGYDGNSFLSDVWYSADGVDWDRATEFAPWKPRGHHTVVSIKERLWLFGGIHLDWSAGTLLQDNLLWSSSDGKRWQEEHLVPQALRARAYHLAITARGSMWVTGGLPRNRKDPRRSIGNSEVWVFTPSSRSKPIQQITSQTIEPEKQISLEFREMTRDVPWSARYMHAAAVFQNKIWLLGGDAGNREFRSHDRYKMMNDVWSSPNGIEWSEITSSAKWSARRGHAVVVFQNRLWVLGGEQYTGMREHSQFGDVWFSEDGIKWNCAVEDAPWGPRRGHAVCVHDNRMWLVGGVADQYMDDVWVSEDGFKWTAMRGASEPNIIDKRSQFSPWPAREYHSLVSFKDSLYLMAGSFLSDVWASRDGKKWKMVLSKAPWAPRQLQSAFTIGERLFLLGGNKGPKKLGDIWSSVDGAQWKQILSAQQFRPRTSCAIAVSGNKVWLLGGLGQNGVIGDVWLCTVLR